MKIFTKILMLIIPTVFSFGELCHEGFKKLQEGNDRYVKDKLEHPDRTSERREAVVAKQLPFAIVLGCSDSRVSPEILFDQGVGDLFVVRVAGNIAGSIELDSIDYAALTFKSCMIVVLGHENCGAVNAVLNKQTKDIQSVAQLIGPSIKEINKDEENAMEKAVKANVNSVVKYLKQTKVIKSLIEEKKIEVIGGYYQLTTGKVEWLKD